MCVCVYKHAWCCVHADVCVCEHEYVYLSEYVCIHVCIYYEQVQALKVSLT